jgi:hypothetical protein
MFSTENEFRIGCFRLCSKFEGGVDLVSDLVSVWVTRCRPFDKLVASLVGAVWDACSRQ